jgi:indolepyruvate ferredoxin oxidoreductase
LADAVRRRADFLVDYQDQALSDKYQALIDRVRDAESEVAGAGSELLTRAVCKAYFKTLAYKDEYEVARLHADTGFVETIRERYGSAVKLRYHLAPPILNSGIDARGRPRKREFGAWMLPAFRILAKLKGLRGGAFDLFGRSEERRMERALIGEFEHTVDQLLDGLSSENIANAAEIVGLYLDIRGYGPVKMQAAEEVRAAISRSLAGIDDPSRKAA